MGSNNNLYLVFWDGRNWVWQAQGTPGVALADNTLNISAVYQSAIDRVMCFAIGNDNNLYIDFWNGKEWVWEKALT